MRKRLLTVLFFACSLAYLKAQETFPLNGISDKRPNKYLLINATVHSEPGVILENTSILIENKRIIAVGKNLSNTKGVVSIDLKGKHVYPGFVDANSDYGMPETKRPSGFNYYSTVFDSGKKGAYAWNEAVKAEVNAAEIYKINEKKAESLREMGFTAGLVNSGDGIVRGTGAVVSFSSTNEQNTILNTSVSRHFSFDKGSSGQSYPVSLMGAVALLRQTYLDADWYEKGGKTLETNMSLAAFGKTKSLFPVFESRDILDILRADKIGDEFGEQYVFVGNGDEYQRIEALRQTKGKVIIPIDFPKPLDLADPLDAQGIGLAKLRHWDLAPSNPAMLKKAGVEFAITPKSSGKEFFKNLNKAVENGLSKNDALASITTVPASMLGMSSELGTVKPKAYANLFITDKEIFEDNFIAFETWVDGVRYIHKDIDMPTLAQQYLLEVDGKTYKLKPTMDKGNYKFELLKDDSVKVKAEVKYSDAYLVINAPLKDSVSMSQLAGFYMDGDVFKGTGTHPGGSDFTWLAKSSPLEGKSVDKKKDKKSETNAPIAKLTLPFNSYGNETLPKQKNYLIKNTTVWTNENEGILENTDVLVENGKIKSVGKNLNAPNSYEVISGEGKHLTTGIIDEHSHIALLSINEIQTVSAHVRQTDVINPDDVNIYRQLAGGVTTSQLLHGSADCIGGQSAIIKLKWGADASELQIPGADQFIKFALGENVKRGNSSSSPNRYPTTRMGVEQVYLDAFSQAKDYKKAWAEYAKKKSGVPPRKDLTLETLGGILDNKVFITCHSYVQSEINMLMNVADSMGFNVNTFTHILEGYKLADKMKERDIYGSTFSDWWAYKMEVKEAIPYNAALMIKSGVTTAINSDDAEMARRLNQEAAKTMLYGGLSAEDAWKTVTLNPAKMLHLDKKLGSVKAGKDADLVLWNDNPLSVYARPEFTMIEGAMYFEHADYEQKMKADKAEKNALIQAMMKSKEKKQPVSKSMESRNSHIHCDTMLEFDGISVEEYESKYLNK
ncbi:Imidazolonepropionase [Spirosomataceae bacterium TFI 002]|nr:Imidazolonepropionase [Spirosomataceae bacterium TFI 002]